MVVVEAAGLRLLQHLDYQLAVAYSHAFPSTGLNLRMPVVIVIASLDEQDVGMLLP